jgi:Putative neutral zinc metallopeptidase
MCLLLYYLLIHLIGVGSVRLDSRVIIKDIFQQQNYKNYDVVVSKGRGSRCDYNKGRTTIYINEVNNKGDANSILVAAHEASHALNYSEGISNPILLKTLERLWWLFTTIVGLVILADFLIPLAVSYEDTIPKSAINISIALHCIFTISYILYYMRDESKTEKRALQELQKVYKNNKIFCLLLEDIQKENNHRLRKWIYLKGIIILIVYLIYPFFVIGITSYIKMTM